MRRQTMIARQSVYQSELTNKLVHMIRFIEQEGREKAEEIDCKTEEEFNILKGGFIQTERLKISKEFDDKEANCKRQNQITQGKEIYKSQMKVVNAKIQIFEELGKIVRERVVQDLECSNRKWNILQHLIVESLYKLLEKEVVIKCRKADENVIKESINQLEEFYEEATGKKIKLSMDETYLPADFLPGVIMRTPNRKISINNTLDDRLKQILKSSLPVMNHVFFGTSKMRK